MVTLLSFYFWHFGFPDFFRLYQYCCDKHSCMEFCVHIVNFSSYMWHSEFNDIHMFDIFCCIYFYKAWTNFLLPSWALRESLLTLATYHLKIPNLISPQWYFFSSLKLWPPTLFSEIRLPQRAAEKATKLLHTHDLRGTVLSPRKAYDNAAQFQLPSTWV